MRSIEKVGLIQATYYVYILTTSGNSALYIGVTSDLVARCIEHRQKKHPNSYSARYNINKLVYFETFSDINLAIAREKQIKAGSREKKLLMIKERNPNWMDLFETEIGKELI